jgi:hypothetical protein
MALHRGRGGRWRRGVGASHQGRRGLAGLAAALSILLLTGCPVIPPPERLAFDTDPRVLRGSYLGSVDTRATPTSMALAGDASLLVASWPGSVEFWDPETSELVATSPTPSAWGISGVSASHLSVDGTGSLVAGVLGGHVLLWDGHDATLVREFDPGDRFASCVYCGATVAALDPAGDLVAVGGGAPHLLVVDTATGAVVHELATVGDRGEFVAFGAGGALLASATAVSSTHYALRVWETDTYGVVFEREGTIDHARAARFAFSADGRRLAVGSATKLELIDLAGGVTVLPLDDADQTWSLALSADGKHATLRQPGDPDGSLAIVDLTTGSTVALIPAGGGASAWSADGRFLLAGAKLVRTTDFEVVHDYATGQLYAIELDATPAYVNPRTYAVSGTLRIDRADGIEFHGLVDGNESHRYVRPQARAPDRATLEIDLHDHPWRLHAEQISRAYDYGLEPDEWWGYVIDRSVGGDQPWTALRLWRGR